MLLRLLQPTGRAAVHVPVTVAHILAVTSYRACIIRKLREEILRAVQCQLYFMIVSISFSILTFDAIFFLQFWLIMSRLARVHRHVSGHTWKLVAFTKAAKFGRAPCRACHAWREFKLVFRRKPSVLFSRASGPFRLERRDNCFAGSTNHTMCFWLLGSHYYTTSQPHLYFLCI